ncbi:type IV toxin-antitoxin system AbiEi family antitoxin domain-containing protein [Dermatobacter hominis]|uniref:type IV toxin-antitoxin system AbiEi family antitoxin domain-containing protein n=1 Tax=Dermatobacter hominis TaxID=2884263 RepID=UPI001D10BEEB|nr:type IV toxin-antitoxin system AbiEi family antitoxin domain-containing protein [Dermatobacter hominis]UDY33968.1 DUF559 domain-containing protein [Dermatobacter hominis]
MDPPLAELTATQMGLVTRRQLAELGMTRHAVDHEVAAGRLVRVTDRVLVLAGTPVTDLVRARCGTLDADGALSGRSDAALWGAPGYDLLPVHVTRLRGGRVRSTHLAIVHEPRQVLGEHITVHRGIPALRPHRLLFDLAATEPAGRVERTLDWMWSRRLVTIPRLERTLEQVAVRGRKGVVLMRELIDDRRDLPAPGSNLERRFEEIVRRALLPPFRRQVDLGDGDSWLGRLDFLSTTRLLVVEIDSELHHAALSDRRTDEERRQKLEAAGFMVRSLDEDDLFHRVPQTITRLQRWYDDAPR